MLAFTEKTNAAASFFSEQPHSFFLVFLIPADTTDRLLR